MPILKILTTIVEIIPLVGQIFAIFGKHKAQKRAKQIEKAAAAVIKGVQSFRETQGAAASENIKNEILTRSITDGTEQILNPLVKKYTAK